MPPAAASAATHAPSRPGSPPCSSTRASRICSLNRAISTPSPRASAARGSFEGAHHSEGVAEHGELQAEVAGPRIAALQRQQAQLPHRKPEILELFDVEAGAGRDRAVTSRARTIRSPRAGNLSSTRLPASSRSVESVTPPGRLQRIDDGEHVCQSGDLEDLHDPGIGHDDVQVPPNRGTA